MSAADIANESSNLRISAILANIHSIFDCVSLLAILPVRTIISSNLAGIEEFNYTIIQESDRKRIVPARVSHNFSFNIYNRLTYRRLARSLETASIESSDGKEDQKLGTLLERFGHVSFHDEIDAEINSMISRDYTALYSVYCSEGDAPIYSNGFHIASIFILHPSPIVAWLIVETRDLRPVILF